MKLSNFCILLAGLLLSACASEGYTPYLDRFSEYALDDDDYERFTLERTACFGFCPIFKVTVDERDFLFFQGERFVTETDGVLSKRLPKGSFKKILRIARDHEFSQFDPSYPNADRNNCGPIATDNPSIILAFDTEHLDHAVKWYRGCSQFDSRAELEEMIAAVDAVLDIDEWVGPRDAFMNAGDEDDDEQSET
ncbi:DUF6438 domain-containing protein [Hyphococcus sp.]|uniref:DUF6438 domain-containing protein n=1 Tax=Hyphococcus sp. TaxID=2038636 RepID=UPI003CCC3FBD